MLEKSAYLAESQQNRILILQYTFFSELNFLVSFGSLTVVLEHGLIGLQFFFIFFLNIK